MLIFCRPTLNLHLVYSLEFILQHSLAYSVKLHLRDGRTDDRTGAENRIWCILALKCDTW